MMGPHIKTTEIRDTHSPVVAEDIRYEMACGGAQHYSDLLARMRILTITQGLLVIAAAGYFFHRPKSEAPATFFTSDYFYSYCVCLFGLLVAAFLRLCLVNYLAHFKGFVNLAARLEEALFTPVDMGKMSRSATRETAAGPWGPWSNYKALRDPRYRNKAWGQWFNNGSVVLIYFTLVALATIDILWMVRTGQLDLSPVIADMQGWAFWTWEMGPYPVPVRWRIGTLALLVSMLMPFGMVILGFLPGLPFAIRTILFPRADRE